MSYEEVESSMSEQGCERCGFFPCDCSDPGRVDPWTGEPGPTTAEQVEAFLPDEEFPNHQPEEPFEEEQPVFVRTEAEKDIRSVVKLRKPIAIMAVGGKAPKASKRERSPVPPRRVARLDTFFDEYDTDLPQRVAMCRAYASFVASTLPKKQKK